MEKHSSNTKMDIVMRRDLNMTKGKYVSQGGHAIQGNIDSIERGDNQRHKEILREWRENSYVKITLCVNSLEELQEVYRRALEQGEAVKYITDNGLTMFNGEPTDTCLSILGYRDDLKSVTGDLRLL